MESFRVDFLLFFLSFVSPFVSSAEDAIIFTSVPDSIIFNTVNTVHSSDLADIFSDMLSYTHSKPYKWPSLGPVDPFRRPEALFLLDLVGVSPELQLNIKGTKFPLENLNDVNQQYDELAYRTEERFKKNAPVLLKINADDELYHAKSEQPLLLKSIPGDVEGRLEKAKQDPDLGRTLQEGTFNISLQADSLFLVELETVKLLHRVLSAHKAVVNDEVPDIYWIQLRSLYNVIQEHGTDSNQAKEAVRLVEEICLESVSALQNTYDNKAIVAVVTETLPPYMLTRKTRSLLQETLLVEAEPNVLFVQNYTAYAFQDDFHVSFILITFTSVVLILAVLGVSVAMWFMDPGRDSIIYRMTSQRKKD